jgi:hypothetical protein
MGTGVARLRPGTRIAKDLAMQNILVAHRTIWRSGKGDRASRRNGSIRHDRGGLSRPGCC